MVHKEKKYPACRRPKLICFKLTPGAYNSFSFPGPSKNWIGENDNYIEETSSSYHSIPIIFSANEFGYLKNQQEIHTVTIFLKELRWRLKIIFLITLIPGNNYRLLDEI